MITATYNVAASDWTRAIDAALSEWSKYLHGNVNLNIDISFRDMGGNLAFSGPKWLIEAGVLDGRPILVPSAATKLLTGAQSSTTDIFIEINPNNAWHFGSPETTPQNAYSAVSVMIHELGHGLFMTENPMEGGATPFEKWSSGSADFHGAHSATPNDIMYSVFYLGQSKLLTANDVEAARHSNLPTDGDDHIFIPLNATQADAGAGHDTAIWLGSFNNFHANLINFEVLEMPNAALSQEQSNLFRLYQAAFGREPDLNGFKSWDGTDLHVAASGFVQSNEFRSMFDVNDHSALVFNLYENILGREPETAGYEYWAGRTDMDASQLLLGFALSAENAMGDVTFLV